jgi:hypothetical protein
MAIDFGKGQMLQILLRLHLFGFVVSGSRKVYWRSTHGVDHKIEALNRHLSSLV